MPDTVVTRVLNVAVPVTDQDVAVAFYCDRLGLSVAFDEELQPGFRWIELTTAGGGARVSLVPADDELPAGVDTGIRLGTADAAAHATLAAAGGDVDELLLWDTAPPMFSLRDPDGNRLYLTQD